MVFARSTPLRRDDPVYPRGTSLLAIRESTINLFSSAQKGSLYGADSVPSLTKVVIVRFISRRRPNLGKEHAKRQD